MMTTVRPAHELTACTFSVRHFDKLTCSLSLTHSGVLALDTFGWRLAWVTQVSESGHRLLVPMSELHRAGNLFVFSAGGDRRLVYDAKARRVLLAPMLTVRNWLPREHQMHLQHKRDDGAEFQLTTVRHRVNQRL